MHKNLAKKLIETNEKSYDFIAADFARTRAFPWSEMKDFLPFVKKSEKVLDVGSGSGRTFELLAEKEVDFTGIDVSQGMVDFCNEKFKEHALKPVFKKANAAKLPFEDNSFDVVTGIAVLHHLPSKELRKKALEEMQRVVRPGGNILLTNWNLWQPKYVKKVLKHGARSLVSEDKYDFGDVIIPWVTKTAVVKRYYHAFTLSSLKKLAEEVGLEIVEHTLYPRREKHSITHYSQSRNIWSVFRKKSD